MDFQTPQAVQGGSLHIYKRAMDKISLQSAVGFFLEKNLQGGTALDRKRISVLHCRIGRLEGSSGLHILTNGHLAEFKVLS